MSFPHTQTNMLLPSLQCLAVGIWNLLQLIVADHQLILCPELQFILRMAIRANWHSSSLTIPKICTNCHQLEICEFWYFSLTSSNKTQTAVRAFRLTIISVWHYFAIYNSARTTACLKPPLHNIHLVLFHHSTAQSIFV